jgi:membrane-bound metal-dependent hydrolase YbcI (DUF457 family)
MSSFHTHMLIGAVGGLAAFRIVEYLAPSALSVHVDIGASTYAIPPSAIGLTVVAVSAFLAVWPDIDESGSWISHQASHVMWLLGAMTGMIVAFAFTQSAIWLAAGFVAGAIIGRIAGGLVLQLLRILSGGHRRMTHSLLVGAALIVAAGIVYAMGLGALSLPLFGLAWGQYLHLAGDVVTPGGVPLFYPLWGRDIRVLPYGIAQFGELIVFGAALLFGLILCLL